MSAKQILLNAGLHNSHWGERIIAAEMRGSFTSADNVHSDMWVTCACGKITADIPRDNIHYFPLDDDLYYLGEDFTEAVKHKDFIRAAGILIKIEKRALEVASQCPQNKS